MNKIITINNEQLKVKEFNGQRVITFKDIDMVHKRVDGTAGRNFRENKDKFIENIDYFSITGKALKDFKQTTNFVGSNTKEVILITASGYLMLVKSLHDDLAWEIQRELVNNYFTVQKVKREYHKPIDRAIRQHFNIAETIIQKTGIKPGLAYAVAVSEAEKETGYSYDEYKKLLPSAEHDIGSFNPTQLGKENKKFKYSLVEKSARSREYETSIDWLMASNMILKCQGIKIPNSPLKANTEDGFKLYLSDMGILRVLAKIDKNEILLNKNMIYKGVLAENYVAEVLYMKNRDLYYWQLGSQYEIDFLINIQGDIIPIEVKASDNITSKSLNYYIKRYKPLYSIRVSTKNFGFSNNIKSVPLYAVHLL